MGIVVGVIGHPSKSSLRSWLTGEDRPRVERHISDCERCAAALEDLDQATGAKQAGRSIAESLERALAPPAGLTDRLEQRVVTRLDAHDLAAYVADLFGAGIETTMLFLTETNGHDQPASNDQRAGRP